MITHAQYHAENPLPNFPAPLDLAVRITPYETQLEKALPSRILPSRILARMKTMEAERIEKYRWMKGKGPMSATTIAAELNTTTSNTHVQLNRLVSTGHLIKTPVGKRFTYEWAL